MTSIACSKTLHDFSKATCNLRKKKLFCVFIFLQEVTIKLEFHSTEWHLTEHHLAEQCNKERHDTQHNNIQHNDTQHNTIHHKGIQDNNG
jgi:hypothetical protein